MTNIIGSTISPNFVANLSANILNVTGDGTVYTCVFNTLTQGNSSYFNTSTGVFTATIPGNYIFTGFIDAGGVAAGESTGLIRLVTTLKNYLVIQSNPANTRAPANTWGFSFMLAGVIMNLNDTASITLQISGGTKTCSLNLSSSFTGKRIS